jgi:hypothetical protein
MAYPQLSLLSAGYVQRLNDHGVRPETGTLRYSLLSDHKFELTTIRLISDAHEWINEIPTVPIYYQSFDTGS